MLEIGQKAPQFNALTQKGEKLSLKELQGKKVALYFYPKDDTPGCTKQACSIRDDHAKLKKEGIIVLGVSPDDVASHQDFEKKYKLPFQLLADPKKTIIEKYGVWGEKNMYGKITLGLKRTTFLIDEKGVIVDIIKRPKTEIHAEEILNRFAKLKI